MRSSRTWVRRRSTIRAWTTPCGVTASAQINHVELEPDSAPALARRASCYPLHIMAAAVPVPAKKTVTRGPTMKKQSVWLLALAAVLVVGCANQKAPAEQAVAGAEAALAAVRDDEIGRAHV